MSRFGGMVAFRVGNADEAARICETTTSSTTLIER